MLDPNSTKTPTASTQDDNLSALADRIRDEHEAVVNAMCHAVAHAISAGEALIQAKAAVPPGNWHRWLRSNCDLSRRTALRYMQFAVHRAELRARGLDISVRAAQRIVSKPKIAALGKRTAALAPTAAGIGTSTAPVDIETVTEHAIEMLAESLTRALKLALDQHARADLMPTTVLRGMLVQLEAHGLDTRDIEVVIRPRSRARAAPRGLTIRPGGRE